MRYLKQHIAAIIEAYDGKLPLAHFLKDYFRRYPKLGSRDRKMLTTLTYSWFRIGKGIDTHGWADSLIDQWQQNSQLFRNFSLKDWIENNEGEISFNVDKLLTPGIPLSEGIDKTAWLQSMLVQPALFLRLRGEKTAVTRILEKHEISYNLITDSCIALPNGTKTEELLPPNSYVVQDASSQLTGSYFHPQKGQSWYDCCSGAGGKSLLLKDMQPAVRLTVSDKRESILANLVKRFQQYRHNAPDVHVTDVADAKKLAQALGVAGFDNIICDAPCSGSGTWARTPEQLYFFDAAAVDRFHSLQKTIAANASEYIKPGGRLFYITCSVFKRENEDVVAALASGTGLRLQEQHSINGIGIKADSMFIAVLQK